MMEYQRTYEDKQFASTVGTALGLASGKSGSFLGDNLIISEKLLGKWNDDIMWWALGALSGAELYGTDAKMPSGITYLKTAQITYDQVWSQWDSKCGGGIYWSRDRTGAKQGYKSAITNAQHILLGSRLYILTKNETYLRNAANVANWMKSSGLITTNSDVLDGIDASQGCKLGQASQATSYISGNF